MNIAGRLKETVTVKRLTARTSSGDATLGTTLTIKARIERALVTKKAGLGEGLDQQTRMFCVEAILLSDFVFFPEDSTANMNTARKPTEVSPVYSLGGKLSHHEVLF